MIWGGELGGLLSMKKKGGCWCWVVGIIGKVRCLFIGVLLGWVVLVVLIIVVVVVGVFGWMGGKIGDERREE